MHTQVNYAPNTWSLKEQISFLREDATGHFGMDYFGGIVRQPIEVFSPVTHNWLEAACGHLHDGTYPRVNHLCIHTPGMGRESAWPTGFPYSPALFRMVNACVHEANVLLEDNREFPGLETDVLDRYWYLTIDRKPLHVGETLREPGWHTDGLQGDEVPDKQPGDLIFLVTTGSNGTQFSRCSMALEHLDLSTQNVFKEMQAQQEAHEAAHPLALDGKPWHMNAKPGHMYMFGSYHVHRSPPATVIGTRAMIRLCFSHVPITSVKMTLNDKISYPYAVHTTSGEIPKHLE